ncbi:lipase 1-like [Homalodisca vitripennis]|uniref:lipase 1-like n=1 Tax=Homalodisca vitripennis TaxID=197043 RepID=UPI001EEA8751|nr:lipase 1-like [Homalodisca vitripennis]
MSIYVMAEVGRSPAVMCCRLLAIPLVLVGSSLVSGQLTHANPFTVKPIENVVKEFGYPIERHDITTEDGYILTYHRIPHGRNHSSEVSRQSRRVVLFSNGILLSSAAALASRDDLAYGLADAEFDVWLGNYRGNMYSRRHTILDPDRDNLFWDFSLHELGAMDLAASIDYILSVTGQQRLLYTGASMGTTMFWVLGATRPEYMEKVESMVAIAPVARPSNSFLVNNWARYYALHSGFTTLQALNYHEVFPYRQSAGAIVYFMCNTLWLKTLCSRLLNIFGLITGQDWDMNRLLEATKYGPAGISTKVVLHYLQIAKAKKFQQYDYGTTENQQYYRASQPPEYNLKNVTCKAIYFVYSDADLIAAKKDVEWLSEQLPKKPKRILHNVNHLGHVDLALDKNVPQLLVKPLIEFMRNLPD